MGTRKEILHTLDLPQAPRSSEPEQPGTGGQSRLDVVVVFTSVAATLTALKRAAGLATQLNGFITLAVPQIVPFPLPLTDPPVTTDFNERRFRVMASESPVQTAVHVYLCRDRFDALQLILKPHSLIVLGGRKRWWPTPERRLAGRLRRAGHEVVLTETE